MRAARSGGTPPAPAPDAVADRETRAARDRGPLRPPARALDATPDRETRAVLSGGNERAARWREMSGKPTDELRSRVLDSVAREPALPRSAHRRQRARSVAFGFAAAGLVAFVKYGLDPAASQTRPAWHVVAEGGVPPQPRPIAYIVLLEAAWIAIAAVATWAGIGRGKSMLGRSATTKATVALLTPVALAVTWCGAALLWLGSLDDTPGVRLHAACALMTLVYAAGPLAAFFVMRGSSDPRSPRLSGAAFGAVAGAWAAALHFPYCECTSPAHVLLGHVAPVAALAVLGAAAGERLLGVHAAAAH